MLLLATALAAGPFGTATPTRVLGAAADGSWALLCQARLPASAPHRETHVTGGFNGLYGDEQAAYLVIGEGPGVELDDVVAVDPSGRRMVVREDGHLLLLQPGARGHDLSARGAAPDFAQFDAAGKRLLYRRGGHLVVRVLASGSEVELDPGPGRLYDAELDPGGEWVTVRMNAPGEEPFSTNQDRAYPACWTGTVGCVVTSRGVHPTSWYLPTSGGPPRPGDGVIGVSGRYLVRRDSQGAVLLETGSSVTLAVPASCAGRVLGVTPEAQIIVSCTSEEPNPVVEYAGGVGRPIGLTIPAYEDADGHGGHLYDDVTVPGRFVLTWDEHRDPLGVDRMTGAVHQPVDERLATFGDRVYARSTADRLVVLDPAGDRELGVLERYASSWVLGDWLYSPPLRVDLRTGAVASVAPGFEVGAVRTDGRLLACKAGWGAGDYCEGPAAWVEAGR